MRQILAIYSKSDSVRLLGLALIYTLFARLVLTFSTANGNVTICWLPGGVALAALLVWGLRFWPAVFFGAVMAGLMVDDPLFTSVFLALGNTAESVAAMLLLKHCHKFDPALESPGDFFYLTMMAAAASCLSALIGPVTLYLSGYLTMTAVANNIFYWWQADLLGIVLGTPLFLIWRTVPAGWLSGRRLPETVLFFALAFLVGQCVFLDWFRDSFIGLLARSYWAFLFVVVAAIRYQQHGVLLITSMTAVQALMGAVNGVGIFGADIAETGLQNFWFYQLVLTATGLALALILQARDRATEELRKSEALFHNLFNLIPDSIFLSSLDGDFINVNQSASERLGYSREELLNLGIRGIDTPEFASVVPERIRELQVQGQAVFESAHVHKDGTVIPVEIHHRLIQLHDRQAILSIARDQTERKRAEQWLLLYGEMVRHMAEGLILISAEDLSIVYSNPAFERMFGYGEHELAGQPVTVLNAAHLSTPEEKAREIVEGLHRNGIWKGEIVNKRKDGTAFWCFANVTHFEHPVWGRVWLSIHQDISERKALEADLNMWANVFQQAEIDLALIDFEQNVIKAVNPSFAQRRGYRPDEMPGMAMETLFPEDRTDEMRQFIQAVDRSGHGTFETEHVRKDGQHFPVHLDITVTETLHGTPLTRVIYAQDITERKRSEESLRLAMLVYQNTNEAMMVTEHDGTIVSVNPAFTQTTGYEMQDVVGKNPNILASGRHDNEFYRHLWESINTTGQWQGEIWNRRKSGELYIEQLAINTVFQVDGAPWRRVALFTDITEKKASEEMLWRQANLDPLTGLPNRRMFYDRLLQETKKSHRSGLPLALMFLDLDRFKDINDTLGHERGDELLQEAGRRLYRCVRDTDTVARLGGDEFTIILGELEGTESIDRIALAILNCFTEPFHLGMETVYVSVSIGITVYPNDTTEIEQLVKNADQAMYAAKNQGRNRYSYFTHVMQDAAEQRLRLTSDLRLAVLKQQFEVYYQPIVELGNGKVCKAEALIRWHHPVRGMVSPASFIPIAEDSGLIHEIGDWVFRTAVTQAKRWREAYCENFQISINKSPVQFRDNQPCHDDWADYLKRLDLPGDCVVIEITEGLLLDAKDATYQKLLGFRDKGIQVSIDDFGTGYSALSYLKKFDIDYLKIDQSFTRNLSHDSNDLVLCEAIVVMAHKLGLKVIAEGVETEQQRELLLQIGCDYGQGYLFSKPLPSAKFSEYMAGVVQKDCLQS